MHMYITSVARILVWGGHASVTVVHTFEAVAGSWVSGSAVSRVMGEAPEQNL